jgi:hypothetical protein
VSASKTTGVPVNRIKASLKAADPESGVGSRDIYNWTARITREGREGRPPNKALIEKLTTLKEEGSLFFEYTLTEEGRIQRLFLTDRVCGKLTFQNIRLCITVPQFPPI